MDYEAVIKHLENRINVLESRCARMADELDRVNFIAVTAEMTIDNHANYSHPEA